MILFAVGGAATIVAKVLAEQEALRATYNEYLKTTPEPRKTYEEFHASTEQGDMGVVE